MKFIRLLAIVVLISVPILFLSCKKTTQLGANVLPAGDFINAVSTDTFTVLTQEEPEFAVPTSILSNYLLGSMKDPVFGTSYAAIFTQVQPPPVYNFQDSTSIDSMVLSLPFYSAPPYYGIQNIPQTINVYQVTQSMSFGVTYYSNQAFSFNPTPIGVKKFLPNVASYSTDSMVVLGDTLAPQLRIKLSSAFVQELMSQSGTTFATNSTFQNFLKGILIAPDTTAGFGGGIMYFDMTNASIFIYGKTGKTASKVGTSTIINTFPINSAVGVTTDYYKHNYTGTPIQSLLKTDSTNNSVLYLQSMGGLRVKVTIPYLYKLGRVLINKAELEFVEVSQKNVPSIDYTSFLPPAAVEVLTDSLNIDYTIEDLSNDFLIYGGTEVKIQDPLSTSDSLAEYTTSIADQLQYELTGNPTGSTINYAQFTSLFLLTYPNPQIADRIVVHGGNAKSSKLVLHLIYTKLNN